MLRRMFYGSNREFATGLFVLLVVGLILGVLSGLAARL